MDASWQAVQIENPEVVRALIAAGADVNAADERGTTALMLAAAMHQAAIVSLLLDAKANVNALNQENEAALIYVPQNEETVEEAIAVVRKLSEAGADLNVRQNKGQTALIIAASRCSPRLVQTLMELKADVNIKDNSGQTAYDNACKIVWDAKGRKRIQAMLRGELENKPDEILIGKVFSADGKKLIITGKGIGKVTVGRKLRIKAASGEITATATEALHSQLKATTQKKGAAAGDLVYFTP
jgi:hypothetical protein